MKVVHTIGEVRDAVKEAKSNGERIGFVATMGFLHEGHLVLVDKSSEVSDFQVMSIFVNRMQFNDPNDFNSYPIDLERDYQLAENRGVDLVFVPDETEMYNERLTYVDIEKMTDFLCGYARPGHFRGVLTVVSKLFNIIQPDVSVFGQKDIQQAASIQKMVEDLNFPIDIILGPIVREDSGLAMSSRNKHLTDDQRERALVLFKSLQKAEELILSGERNESRLVPAMTDIISSGKPTKIDYITLAGYHDLQPVSHIENRCVLAVAAYFGETRLIDNMVIEMKGDTCECVY